MEEMQRALLMKEQDELNSWARLVGQTYFAWFIFCVTVNATALALVFNTNSLLVVDLRLWRATCSIFVLWNVTATASSFIVRQYVLQVDARLKDIYSTLYKSIAVDWYPPRNSGSIAEFVGKRAMEKGAPWKSPKAGLSHYAWKSRKSGGISTFPTAPTTTG